MPPFAIAAYAQRHLDRRHRDAVADRDGADRRARPLAVREGEAGRLAGEVDAGLLAEAEAVDPVREPALAEPLRDRDRPDVRRALDDAAHGHPLRPAVVRLVDHAVGDLQRRRQDERAPRRDRVLLERRCDGHELERRAGLVRVRHCAVAAPVGACGREAVRIEPGRGRHREHVSGVRVHHDRRRRPRSVSLDRLGEDRLGIGLDLVVDRQPHVPAGRLRAASDTTSSARPSGSFTIVWLPGFPASTLFNERSRPSRPALSSPA